MADEKGPHGRQTLMNNPTAEYIQAHRDRPAADIAAALAADPRFERRIGKDPLRALLQGSLIGAKMQQAWENKQLPLELRGGLWSVIQTAAYDNGYIDTQDPAIAANIRTLGPTVVALGILTQDEADALLALAGGPLLDRLTAAEVQAELDRLTALDTAAALLETARTQSAALLAESGEAVNEARRTYVDPLMDAHTARTERHRALLVRLESALRDLEARLSPLLPTEAEVLAELEA